MCMYQLWIGWEVTIPAHVTVSLETFPEERPCVGKEGSLYLLMAVGRDSERQVGMTPICSSPHC